MCYECGENDGRVHCWECGPSCLLCAKCDLRIHIAKVLHNRDIWTGLYFKPVSSTEFFDEITNEIMEIGKI